jgi:putative tricarboxylic transport membrane protein
MEMDVWQHVAFGFNVALTPMNLLLCLAGVLMGTLVGVLPGLGPGASLSLLLPMTFGMDPTGALIMLSGLLYGTMYGGSTTSILVNMPGEAAAVVTCLDGYQMARQGRAGPALGIAAFGSFIAGTFSIIGLTLVAPPLADLALKFGPPEYFCLTFLGMTMLVVLASGNIIKALMVASFGFLLASIGQEVFTGTFRFTFGIFELYDGLGIVPVIMGLFGISEVLMNLETRPEVREVIQKITGLLPTLKDWKDSIGPISRATLLGFFLGSLPGGGAILSTFASYTIEKKLSKTPERFGKGAIEGVAGPESANNAAEQASFIPMLSLGIPANPALAILMGALMMHNIIPGPLMMTEHPDLFWGVICSMYIGNAMLLVLNLPLIGMWVQVLKVPYGILFPLISLVCLVGAYTMKASLVDVVIMIIFGNVGYLMKKAGYELAPAILGMILGGIMEPALRRSLIISNGSFRIFFTNSPISLGLTIATLVLFISPVALRFIRKHRKTHATIHPQEG